MPTVTLGSGKHRVNTRVVVVAVSCSYLGAHKGYKDHLEEGEGGAAVGEGEEEFYCIE